MAVEAYCVKCRTKREMQDPQQVTMKNGRPAMSGKCPVCGTTLYRIGGGEGKSGGTAHAAGESTSKRGGKA